jgi:hypothetical protein
LSPVDRPTPITSPEPMKRLIEDYALLSESRRSAGVASRARTRARSEADAHPVGAMRTLGAWLAGPRKRPKAIPRARTYVRAR